MSVEDAMKKYHKKVWDEQQKELGLKKKRKNKKPEKDLVEDPCRKWMKEKGWDYNVIESKATWSPKAGKWIQQSAKAGMPDCEATDCYGFSCWIEFKAPGNRKKLRANQREFLKNKIEKNAFAVVVEGPVQLENLYHEWIELRWNGRLEDARAFLINALP